jgi:hypothetical protein
MAGRHAGRHGEAAIFPRAARVPAKVAGRTRQFRGRVEVARTIGAISLIETERFGLTAVTPDGLRKPLPDPCEDDVKAFGACFPVPA